MTAAFPPPRTTRAADFGRVAVLMGGTSSEREVSLDSGRNVLDALRARGVAADAVDGIPALVDAIRAGRVDRVFNILHGHHGGGEDGGARQAPRRCRGRRRSRSGSGDRHRRRLGGCRRGCGVGHGHGRGRHGLDRRDEAVAELRHRLDEPRRLGGVSQRGAQPADRRVEPVLDVDEVLPGPQGGAEVLAGDHPAGLREQLAESEERLLLEPYPAAAAQQLVAAQVDLELPEPDAIGREGGRHGRAPVLPAYRRALALPDRRPSAGPPAPAPRESNSPQLVSPQRLRASPRRNRPVTGRPLNGRRAVVHRGLPMLAHRDADDRLAE